MAISATVLTEGGSTTDGTVFTTASVTLTANRLYLLGICAQAVDETGIATITSTGATWVGITSVQYDDIASPDKRLQIVRTMVASDQTGTITATYASTKQSCVWILVEVTGTDTSGTNGSGAIVQSATNRTDSATSLAVTLASFADAVNNACLSFQAHGSADAITTELTALGDQNITLGTIHLRGQWILGEELTPNMTTASARRWGGVAVEIKAAAAAVGPSNANKVQRSSKHTSRLAVV